MGLPTRSNVRRPLLRRRRLLSSRARRRTLSLCDDEKLVCYRSRLLLRERERRLEGGRGDGFGAGNMSAKLEPNVAVIAVNVNGIRLTDCDSNDPHSLWRRHNVDGSSAFAGPD